MAQWAKVLTTLLGDQSLIPGTQLKGGGEKRPHKVILWPPTHMHILVHCIFLFSKEWPQILNLPIPRGPLGKAPTVSWTQGEGWKVAQETEAGSARAGSPGKQVSESRHCGKVLSSVWEHGPRVTQVHSLEAILTSDVNCNSLLLYMQHMYAVQLSTQLRHSSGERTRLPSFLVSCSSQGVGGPRGSQLELSTGALPPSSCLVRLADCRQTQASLWPFSVLQAVLVPTFV